VTCESEAAALARARRRVAGAMDGGARGSIVLRPRRQRPPAAQVLYGGTMALEQRAEDARIARKARDRAARDAALLDRVHGGRQSADHHLGVLRWQMDAAEHRHRAERQREDQAERASMAARERELQAQEEAREMRRRDHLRNVRDTNRATALQRERDRQLDAARERAADRARIDEHGFDGRFGTSLR